MRTPAPATTYPSQPLSPSPFPPTTSTFSGTSGVPYPTTVGPSTTFGTTGQPAPTFSPGPSIQPPPSFDPYGGAPVGPGTGYPYYPPPTSSPPYGQQPGALFPEGVPWQSPGGYEWADGSTIGRMRRFLQEVRFEYTWVAGDHGPRDFDVNTLDLSATFAVPVFYDRESPFLITPGFAVHYFEEGSPFVGAPAGLTSPGLPPRVYDAYLDVAWKPQLTPWFGGDLGVRTGVFSDFQQFNRDTLRLMGRGLGVITMTPNLQIALGIVYLDRNDIKLLPAGGLIWTPNEDMRYEIVFPNPKLAQRFTSIGTTEWWWYVAGEYGGGSWTIENVPPVPGTDSVDYNDIRVILGLEWTTLSGLRGLFEVGYVFDREILYAARPPARSFKPEDTVMLRGGIVY